MELKDYVTIIIAILALVVSVVTFVWTKRQNKLEMTRSFIDMKYDVLTLIQIQQEMTGVQTYRLQNLISTEDDDKFKKETAFLRELNTYMNNLDKALRTMQNSESKSVTEKGDLEIRELHGLLRNCNSMLESGKKLIENLEKKHGVETPPKL